MTAPQITIIVLLSINLLLCSYLHGKPRKDNYNFWHSFLNAIILISILYWGNFFN